VEVPFSLKVIETGLPQIVSGAIDLVFREPDGWVIADYKTDTVDGNLDKLADYYRPQVELYKKSWEEMTGERVKETGLFFVGLNQWVAIG
jgi:ATP-dependent helicase/nuclease subunit A